MICIVLQYKSARDDLIYTKSWYIHHLYMFKWTLFGTCDDDDDDDCDVCVNNIIII